MQGAQHAQPAHPADENKHVLHVQDTEHKDALVEYEVPEGVLDILYLLSPNGSEYVLLNPGQHQEPGAVAHVESGSCAPNLIHNCETEALPGEAAAVNEGQEQSEAAEVGVRPQARDWDLLEVESNVWHSQTLQKDSIKLKLN